MIVLMSHSLSKLCGCASERLVKTDARATSKLHLAASVWISHNRLHSHVQLCLANTNPSDLVRERDENVQSTAVDAIELKDRLE